MTALALMRQTLPYAIVRFAILLAYVFGVMAWLCVMIGGAIWCADHLSPVVSVIWFALWLLAHWLVWRHVLRYWLYSTTCGHIAVLTELITRNSMSNGAEAMFAYGRRIVTLRFAEVTLLFELQTLVRGVLRNFHRSVEWTADLLPFPGVPTLGTNNTYYCKNNAQLYRNEHFFIRFGP